MRAEELASSSASDAAHRSSLSDTEGNKSSSAHPTTNTPRAVPTTRFCGDAQRSQWPTAQRAMASQIRLKVSSTAPDFITRLQH